MPMLITDDYAIDYCYAITPFFIEIAIISPHAAAACRYAIYASLLPAIISLMMMPRLIS